VEDSDDSGVNENLYSPYNGSIIEKEMYPTVSGTGSSAFPGLKPGP